MSNFLDWLQIALAPDAIHQQQGDMSIGYTSDGRIVRLPYGEGPETQKLETVQAGAGYTNRPTVHPEIPFPQQTFPTIDVAERDAKSKSQDRTVELILKGLGWAMRGR